MLSENEQVGSAKPRIWARVRLIAFFAAFATAIAQLSATPVAGDQSGLLAMWSAAQTGKTTQPKSVETSHTFTDRDGSFRFTYSGALVRCLKDQDQPESWGPDDSCEAYFPMCEFRSGPGSRTLVCFAFQKGKFKPEDRAVLEAATFSVAMIDGSASEEQCLSLPASWTDDSRATAQSRTLHGAKFKVSDVSESSMNQTLDGQVYRSFHGGKCYELRIRIATGSAGVARGTIYKFTERDRESVRRPLERALASFRFLK